MSVTIRQLRVFLTVAEARNFTRAAAQMGLGQPVISGLIQELEQELGFRLFDRTTRRVELTDAALEFLDDSRRIIADFEQSVNRARDVGSHRRGTIAIGAPPLLAAALLPDVIRDFARSSPGVQVTLFDRAVPTIHQMIRNGRLELGVGTFQSEEEGIAKIPLIADRFSLFCPVDHPLALIVRPTWKDLSGFPLVTLRRESGIREQVERGFAARQLVIEPVYELDQMSTVLALVKAGFGITVLPIYALAAPSLAGVVARPLTDPLLTREIVIIRREDRTLSPAAVDFIRQLKIGAARLGAAGGGSTPEFLATNHRPGLQEQP
jgi:DNA-binding transcriptional LysR family regulator